MGVRISHRFRIIFPLESCAHVAVHDWIAPVDLAPHFLCMIGKYFLFVRDRGAPDFSHARPV